VSAKDSKGIERDLACVLRHQRRVDEEIECLTA
jgi:hypothetical protein